MNVIVSINGSRQNNVLANIAVHYGRQKIDGAFPASTCTVQLLATDSAPFGTAIRDVLTIDVSGVRVFYGRVTDRQLEIAYIDAGRIGTVQTVIAAGVLADLGRTNAGAVDYPAETDGQRANRIIGEAVPVPPAIDTVTDTIGTTIYSIDVFRASGLDTFDNGVVALLPRAAKPDLASNLVANGLDPSAPGIYETSDGRIGYADANRRPWATDSVTVPATAITTIGIGSGVADIVNQATVTYGSPTATVTGSEPLSQAIFGVVGKDYTTQLSSSSDASTLAKRVVESRSEAQDNLERLVIDLEHPNTSPTLSASLLGLKASTPINVTGLDTRLGIGASWSGFVEGWTLGITTGHTILEIYVSARRYSIPLAIIDDIAAAVNTLTGAVDGLAILWSAQRTINQSVNTINTSTGTFDTPYSMTA